MKQQSIIRKNFRNRYIPQQELLKPSQAQAQEIKRMTQNKLLAKVIDKTSVNFGTNVNTIGKQQKNSFKYISKSQGGTQQKHRFITIQQKQTDPFNPSIFKHKKTPKGIPQLKPPQILRSPQQKLTQQQYNNWKIPPCTSNWNNNKGYVVPLQMRLAANGRSLQQHTINQRFADVVDTLTLVQSQCRQQLQDKAKVQKSIDYKQHLLKQQKMKKAVEAIRAQKLLIQQRLLNAHADSDNKSQNNLQDRQQIRHIRRRQLQRQARLNNMGFKSKNQVKQAERKISQKIDLKRPNPTSLQDIMDQRVLGRTAGMDQGFGQSDQENVYDKALFEGKRSGIHKVQIINSQDDLPGQTIKGVKRIKFQKVYKND